MKLFPILNNFSKQFLIKKYQKGKTISNLKIRPIGKTHLKALKIKHGWIYNGYLLRLI